MPVNRTPQEPDAPENLKETLKKNITFSMFRTFKTPEDHDRYVEAREKEKQNGDDVSKKE